MPPDNQNNRDKMELRIALRRLEAAEHAIIDARETLAKVLSQEQTPASALASVPAAPPPQPLAPIAPSPVLRKPQKPQKSAKPPVPVETKVLRVIAVIGSLITVAGVGFGVSLAISSGLLGPLGRVLLGVLLAAILLGAALWLQGRKGALAGISALAVTSYLVLATVLFSLVHILEWWAPVAGSIAHIVSWLGFLYLSRLKGWWPVAVSMGVAAIIVINAHFLNGDPGTWMVALMPLLLLGMTWRTLRPEARLTAAGLAIIVQLSFPTWNFSGYVSASLLALVSAIAFAVITLIDPRDLRTGRVTGVIAPMMLLVFASGVTSNYFNEVGSTSALVTWLLIPGVVTLVALGHHFRTQGDDVAPTLELVALCATAMSFLLVWQMTPPLGAGTLIDATVIVALFFLAASAITFWLSRHPVPTFTSLPWAFWVAASLVITWSLGRNVLMSTPLWLTDHTALVQALLIAGFLAVVFTQRKALINFELWAQIGFVIAGLYLSMVSIVTAITWAGSLIGDTTGMWLGYLIGHASVSVLWMVLAAWVLLAKTGLSERVSLGTGVLLASAGVLKLVFFDLGNLEGVTRVVAFIISGIALLAMASLRSRGNNQSTSAR